MNMPSRACRHPDFPFGAVDLEPGNRVQSQTEEWFPTLGEAIEKARKLKSGVVMITPDDLEDCL